MLEEIAHPQTDLILEIVNGGLFIKESKSPAKIARGFMKQFLVNPNFDINTPSEEILEERKNSSWE